MRTRYYTGTAGGTGSYTFPQPLRLKKVQSVIACRLNATHWESITLYWQTANNPTDPLSAVVIPTGTQCVLDGNDHLLYAVQNSNGLAQGFALTFLEDA